MIDIRYADLFCGVTAQIFLATKDLGGLYSLVAEQVFSWMGERTASCCLSSLGMPCTYAAVMKAIAELVVKDAPNIKYARCDSWDAVEDVWRRVCKTQHVSYNGTGCPATFSSLQSTIYRPVASTSNLVAALQNLSVASPSQPPISAISKATSTAVDSSIVPSSNSSSSGATFVEDDDDDEDDEDGDETDSQGSDSDADSDETTTQENRASTPTSPEAASRSDLENDGVTVYCVVCEKDPKNTSHLVNAFFFLKQVTFFDSLCHHHLLS